MTAVRPDHSPTMTSPTTAAAPSDHPPTSDDEARPGRRRDRVTRVDSLAGWADALRPTLVAVHDYQQRKAKETSIEHAGQHWPRVTENVVSIRFTDCDPFGHLNNGRYIDYFINGRDFHMETFYGLNLAHHALSTNETYIVTRHQIAYVRPAMVRERVLIRASLLGYQADQTFVESQMLDERGRSVKALLWSEFSYLNLKTRKATRQPQWVLDILKEIVTPNEHSQRHDFEGRLVELQRTLRAGG